jgi:hypothetical protein
MVSFTWISFARAIASLSSGGYTATTSFSKKYSNGITQLGFLKIQLRRKLPFKDRTEK